MKQTVMWTALPNGVANGKLRLSVFVSPRLEATEAESHSKLQPFTDFVEWPARIAAAQFQVQFGNRPPIAATRVEPTGAEGAADMWRAMINADTFLEPVKLPDWDKRAIRSFSVRNVMTHLKQAYQATAIQSPTVVPKVAPARLQSQPVGRFLGELAPPAAQRTALKNQLDTQLRASPTKALFNPAVEDASSVRTRALAATPAGANVPKAAVSAVTVDFHQLNSFYRPTAYPPRVERIRLPVEPPTMDFHKILSSLGQFPGVMRLVGLVIDLEVPFDAALQGQTTVTVIPTWSPVTATTNVTPRTRCTIGADRFVAQPRPDSDIANGMLKLNDDTRFEVGQVDVDGAAIKAMTVAEEAQTGEADEEKNAALPSLRSAGIWVARVNRAHQLATTTLPRLATQNVQLVNLADKKAGQVDDLYAEDVSRGYRVDVLDEAAGQWRSLCERIGEYHFRNTDVGVNRKVTLEDEGWASSAATESTEEDDDDLYVHEVLFTWNGWSMVAPRPMRALPQEGTPKAKPAEYGLETSFTPKPGSLPRLRFGHSYRMRVRVVDLAGNSVPPETADGSAASDPVEYARHEPVSTPIVTPRTDLAKSPGETLERMVIRTYNEVPAKDTQPSPEACERHIAPPKTSESMAEWHGKFDSDAGMKGDAATYQLIIDNDGSLKEVEEAEQLELPYLPDPLAVGATIRSVQIDVAPGPEDEVVKVPYEGDWPDWEPFRTRIVEERGDGGKGAEFYKSQRRLVIPVPKAEIAEIWLSSYLDEPEVPNMGVYRWTVEGLAAPAIRKAALQPAQLQQVRRQLYTPTESAQAAQAVRLEPAQLQRMQLVSTAVLKGIHWMVTPYRKITLVHAVQQPLVTPDLSDLKTLKGFGNTYATLEDKFPISGKSTIKVDVLSEWDELIDPLSEPTWRTLKGKAHVVELPVQYGDTEIVMGSPQEPAAPGGVRTFTPIRAMGVPMMRVRAGEPKPDRMSLAPRLLMLRVMGPRHEFGDTKYRSVKYKAVATTRFREYFPFTDEDISSGKAKITRENKPVTVDVLSSARPLPPRVRYVIPTFGWETEQAAGGTTSKRLGGGLRVYLERPWFSSGEGELLGVVLPSKQATVAARAVRALAGGGIAESLKRYVTQTGADPIFRSGSMKPAPDPSDFGLAVQSEDGLTLDEVPGAKVAVVGHKVQFDPSRQLWYCDIQLNPQDSYYPFVRLALARYQPKSVQTDTEDCKLSHVVLADFAQLAPDRAAGVSYDAANRMAQVSVTGMAYGGPLGGGSEMEMTLETRQPGVAGPLGWVPAGDAVPLTLTKLNDRLSAWVGRLPVPGDQPPERFRVVVKEYERFVVDNAPEGAPKPAMVVVQPTDRRLVYADVLKLGGPDEGEG